MPAISAKPALGSALRDSEGRWGWFIALGVGLLIAGLIASTNLLAATLVSIIYIAAMMLIGGGMQVAHAFTAHGWGRRAFYSASGLLYAVAGAIAVYNPLLASLGLALLIGFMLIASGALRIVQGAQDQRDGWGWVVASGVVTLICGAVVVAAWPTISLWLLGAFLTFDLLFQGVGFVAFGLAIRRRAKRLA